MSLMPKVFRYHKNEKPQVLSSVLSSPLGSGPAHHLEARGRLFLWAHLFAQAIDQVAAHERLITARFNRLLPLRAQYSLLDAEALRGSWARLWHLRVEPYSSKKFGIVLVRGGDLADMQIWYSFHEQIEIATEGITDIQTPDEMPTSLEHSRELARRNIARAVRALARFQYVNIPELEGDRTAPSAHSRPRRRGASRRASQR